MSILKLLNQTVTITRKTDTQISASGERIDAYETIATLVKIRIVNYQQFDASEKEIGWRGLATDLGILLSGTDIKENDVLIANDAREFLVNKLDPSPGGVIGHHIEVGLTERKLGDV